MSTTAVASASRWKEQELAPKRLNVGCGAYPLLFWTNLDGNPRVRADIHAQVPPLPYTDGQLDEIYAGHFLEHLTPKEADAFLQECFRCLSPGGRIGILVPDTREVVKRYIRQDIDEIEYPRGVWRKISDLNTLCELFFYSTVQESSHKWCYDSETLGKLLVKHGFILLNEIDRFKDPRIALGTWYQCGWDARRP